MRRKWLSLKGQWFSGLRRLSSSESQNLARFRIWKSVKFRLRTKVTFKYFLDKEIDPKQHFVVLRTEPSPREA